MEIFDLQEGLAQFAGPGGWNDPDLLMVGLYGKGGSSSVNGRFKGCTFTEYRSHFALWSMLAAPLIVNLDLSTMDPATLQLLTNKHLVAINQDKLGRQATTVLRSGDFQVLLKPLSGNRYALCLFNRAADPRPFKIDLKKDLNLWQPLEATDVWTDKTQAKASLLEGSLEGHDCKVYVLKGI